MKLDAQHGQREARFLGIRLVRQRPHYLSITARREELEAMKRTIELALRDGESIAGLVDHECGKGKFIFRVDND